MDHNHLQLDAAHLLELEKSLDASISALSTKDDLEMVRRDWLSKDGIIKSLFQKLRDVPAENKAAIAHQLNQLKLKVETFISQRSAAFEKAEQNAQLAHEYFDLSLPALTPGLGRVHPITIVERKIAAVLKPFGFQTVVGPEIETDYYCFDALNIPKHHPARDMQDTFYTTTENVVRTHTTSIQSRVLQKGELPVKIAAFGRAYRNETEDASHQAMFHQFELVWLEPGLTLANLQALISHILKELFGKRRKIRFVPKFYPYTEPSLGPQIDCGFCKGSGCSACGGSGWATVGGSGMIHRNVLREFKYDPEKVSGFAFGLGTSRLAAQFSGLPTLKAVYGNDLIVQRGAL